MECGRVVKKIVILIILFLSHVAVTKSVCDSQITREMEQCAKSNYAEADAALNQQYADLILNLSDADKARVRETQRYWVS